MFDALYQLRYAETPSCRRQLLARLDAALQASVAILTLAYWSILTAAGRRRKKSRNKRSLDFLIRLKRQSSTDEGDGADASNSCYDAPVSYEEAALKQLPHYATAKFEPEQVQQVCSVNACRVCSSEKC